MPGERRETEESGNGKLARIHMTNTMGNQITA